MLRERTSLPQALIALQTELYDVHTSLHTSVACLFGAVVRKHAASVPTRWQRPSVVTLSQWLIGVLEACGLSPRSIPTTSDASNFGTMHCQHFNCVYKIRCQVHALKWFLLSVNILLQST